MHAYEDALANEDSDVDFDEQAMASPPEEMGEHPPSHAPGVSGRRGQIDLDLSHCRRAVCLSPCRVRRTSRTVSLASNRMQVASFAAMEGCMAPAPSEMDMAVALHHHQGHDQLVTLTQDYLFSHCWEPHRRGAREMASKGGNCRQAMRGHAVRRSGALRQPRPTSMGCH
jgi:hypothetical protein